MSSTPIVLSIKVTIDCIRSRIVANEFVFEFRVFSIKFVVIMFFNVGVLIKNDIDNGESMDEDIEPLNLGLKISSYAEFNEKGMIMKVVIMTMIIMRIISY